MSAPEIETDNGPEIDWEGKFHKQVSDNIRHSSKASIKLAKVQLELDQAQTEIRDLRKQIKALTPAQERLNVLDAAAAKAARESYAKIQELREEIREMKRERGAGQRAILESVISFLHKEASRLPASEPETTTGQTP